METDIGSILKSREVRYKTQRLLLKKYQCTLISFTLNVPGQKKQSDRLIKIHNKGMELLCNLLPSADILFMDSGHPVTGSEGLVCIKHDAVSVKRLACELEHDISIGRIFDIDVFDDKGRVISRSEAGYPERECFVCDEYAKICIRNQQHTAAELLYAFEKLIEGEI